VIIHIGRCKNRGVVLLLHKSLKIFHGQYGFMNNTHLLEPTIVSNFSYRFCNN